MDNHAKKVRLSTRRLRLSIAEFLSRIANADTRGTYDRSLREFVRWFEKTGNFRFQVNDVRQYKRYLMKTRKLSEVSVSTYLTALRRLCAFLVEQRVLPMNPAELVEGMSRPRIHVRPMLTDGDVDRLFNVIVPLGEIGSRDMAIVRLMLDCGLSEAEIVTADLEDYVCGGGTGNLAVRSKGRVRKDRTVVLQQEVVNSLSHYQSIRREMHGDPKPADPLFLSAGNRTRGERMSTRGLRGIINHYLAVAGLKKNSTVTPYSLRHTAARRMADAGATPDEIRERMRLGTIATAKLYMTGKR